MKNTREFIFGTRAIIEGIRNDANINKLFLKKNIGGELGQELLDLARKREIPFQYVPVEKLNKITMKNHQGAIAFTSPVPYHKIENILPALYEEGKIPFILILDQITDVRNFGAIARTAECAGVDAIIVPAYGSVQITSDAIKTSTGALHTIPVCRSFNMKKTLNFIKNSGVQLVATTEKAADNYFESELVDPIAIIMGSEEKGISNELLTVADKLLKMPIIGKIESLNVSVACGVMIYEVVRQRQLAGLRD